MFRIYNTENKCWVKENIYMSPKPHSDLYTLKKGLFGRHKLKLISGDNYIVHREIGLFDMNGESIYEGDFIAAQVSEDRIVTGVVAYAVEFSAYILWCDNSNEYFVLGTEVSNYIRIIGNVFDGREEVETKTESSTEETTETIEVNESKELVENVEENNQQSLQE